MIEYIINNSTGCLIYQESCNHQIKGSSLAYIKRLCVEHLFTYGGYLNAVQAKFALFHKVPLCISDAILLIPSKRTRDYDNIWINYASIFKIEEIDRQTKIIFYSGNELYINVSLKTMKKQIRYLEEIRNTKVKHFHR
jgi:competence transcription factor ComK